MEAEDRSTHRIEVGPADAHVRVIVNGEVVADTRDALMLDEKGLPPRYYIPAEDVRMELLTPTTSSTHCPFKGDASYWSVEAGGRVHPDLAWAYKEPLPEVAEIAGRLSFYNEKVDIEVDGDLLERPKTPWS